MTKRLVSKQILSFRRDKGPFKCRGQTNWVSKYFKTNLIRLFHRYSMKFVNARTKANTSLYINVIKFAVLFKRNKINGLLYLRRL